VNLLGIGTILTGVAVSYAICAWVIGSVRRQHRRRFPRLDLWTVSVILLALRGSSRIYRHKFWSAVRA